MAMGMLGRGAALGALAAILGCAATGTQTQAPEWQSALDEQAKSQARLDLRVEEVTRNLLVLRQRIETIEEKLESLEQARQKAETAPMKVVELQPAAVPEPKSTVVEKLDPAAADLYRKAFNAYREGRYGQAILDFEDFLRAHPDHEYADNAQYWVGESYYSQGEYEQAVVEFNRVLERYPHEAKTPDALLKIGLAYEKLGQADRAQVFWERLLAQHPHTEAAREAQQRAKAAN